MLLHLFADIAVSIQTKRKAIGLTQKELADKLGVSQAMVSRWGNGEENFTEVFPFYDNVMRDGVELYA